MDLSVTSGRVREPFLRFSGVSKSFVSGDQPEVITEFNLDLREGEVFCLLGPSGCGKTTALNMLAGFEFPTAGTITLENLPITRPHRDRGVVFQGEDALFGWLTALENVEFGLKMRQIPKAARRERAISFLNLVGLRGHGDKFPHELSGGMKQRIQIARVLANDPKIVLMDEPFAALDAQTRKMMQDELVRIWSESQKTILFITHDIEESIILADRVGIMTAGPKARLRATIEIALDRPRARTDSGFIEYYRKCSEIIEEEVKRSLTRDDMTRSR